MPGYVRHTKYRISCAEDDRQRPPKVAVDGSSVARAQSCAMIIRQARPTDAALLLEIYRPVVENTVASFELIPPTKDEFAFRIASSIESHEWLVTEDAGLLTGYAYATPHRAREAYKYSVETSVYIHTDYRGKGLGKKLYKSLFRSLKTRDFHYAYAGITLPNVASIAMHKSFGFEPIGTFREIGFKRSEWHDVSWWQRAISN